MEGYYNRYQLKSGRSFFRQSQKEAKRTLYEKDTERFMSRFTRENVLEEIANNGAFELESHTSHICINHGVIMSS